MPIDLLALQKALQGRYAITGELGSGGMAVVYLARDLRHDRRVAIKVLRSELGNALATKRFLREIRVSAGLTHPHILSLHDSGRVADHLFYVMPFVEGETLRDRLRRERSLPVEEACRIATEVADALDYAHRHDVLHRDIKPENILLSDGHAVVADFGLARALERAGGERLTQTGIVLGTPVYASPEHCLGRDPIDGRTDQYSLAVVLYEMLAGELPFKGSNSRTVIARKSSEDPTDLRVRRPAVPPHVAGAVHRALARLPADRFRSTREFADALAASGVAAASDALGAGDGRETQHSFWYELKRRHVYHTAVIYAGAAWVLIEVADTTFPYLRAPDRAVTALIAVAIVGFPIAIVLAWLYEITRDGVHRTEVIRRETEAAD